MIGTVKLRTAALMVCLTGAILMSDAFAQGNRTYIQDKEIAFEMSSSTKFVRIPAEYNWVKVYSLKGMNSPVVRNKIDVSDGSYRFTIGVEELRKLSGKGSRQLPIKTKIIDKRSKKEKSFHITSLMVRFRVNGGADVEVDGYIFDK